MVFGRPAPTSAFCRGFEAGTGVFDDQLALELVEGGGHVEEQPSLWSAWCRYSV